jgi:uncharacterized membrane protein
MKPAPTVIDCPCRDAGEVDGNPIEALVGFVLLVGVLSSVGLVTAGWAWHWVRTGQLELNYSTASLTLSQYALSSLRTIVSGLVDPRALINMGIAALMFTPYVRVLVSLLYFVTVDRNWKYTVFTGFVLVVLTYSLFLR